MTDALARHAVHLADLIQSLRLTIPEAEAHGDDARFTLAGHRMIEMKFRSNVYMARDQGELMLTREIRDIASSHNAQAVIVGTYAQSSDLVFVNLKVIQPETNVVLAVHDYALPLDNMTRSMLRANR